MLKSFSLSISIILFTIYNSLFAKTPSTHNVNIRQVTMFSNQAQVIAQCGVDIPGGTNTLRFSGFGQSIVPNSVLVRAKGNFIIMSINQDFNYLQQGSRAETVKFIKDSLRLIGKTIKTVTSEIDNCQKEAAFLQANYSIKGQGNISLPELQKALEFFNQKFSENSNKMLNLNQKLDDLKKRETRLNEQLHQYESGVLQPEPLVELVVKATQATKAEFEFQYMVANAGWTPMYDLRVTESSNKLMLQLKASSYQNTGIDWEKVSIRFSTGNPSFTSERPFLQAQYVDFLQPVYPMAKKRFHARAHAAAGAPSMQANAPEVMMMADAMTMEEYVAASDRGLETEFILELPVSMASSPNSKEMDIKTLELPLTFQHVAVPKLSHQVYFLALTHGWEKEDLMAGKANVYFDGAFVGSTFINPNQNSDTVQISLGVDNKISLKRERNLYQEKNLLGNRKTDQYTFTITIKNNRKIPINLRVEDQYPLSQNESIKIELKETSGAKKEESDGKLIWNITLKSGEQQVRSYKYWITYPSDRKVPQLF